MSSQIVTEHESFAFSQRLQILILPLEQTVETKESLLPERGVPRMRYPRQYLLKVDANLPVVNNRTDTETNRNNFTLISA